MRPGNFYNVAFFNTFQAMFLKLAIIVLFIKIFLSYRYIKLNPENSLVELNKVNLFLVFSLQNKPI
jgi:hypothetical protein